METKTLNIKIKNYFEEYKLFKQTLSEQINYIKDKFKDIDLSNIIINDKEIEILFIFFSHLKENIINQEIYNFNDNNNKYYNIIMNFTENTIKNYKYYIFYYWFHFIIISLIKEIKYYLIDQETFGIKDKTININKLIYIFKNNNDIITILYKNNKLNIKEIISILNIYIIWLDDKNHNEIKNKISYDKYLRIKNYYLFKMYFNLLRNIFLFELKNNKEKEIKEIFHYLNKINSFIDINNKINNNTTIINNKTFQDFLIEILTNINLTIYEKYKNNILDFAHNIYKNTFCSPKIIENIINNVKKCFLNLSIINKNNNSKNIIENDLLTQNFYCKLLYSLFDDYASNLDHIKFFNYNGFDSKMSFKLSQCSLINTILFFSFSLKIENINLSNNKNIYPLFTIYDESKNQIIIKLYIKQKTKKEKFILYIKQQEKGKDLLMNELPFIENNKTYYIALYFEEKNISIYSNKTKNPQIIKIKNFSNNKENIIQIGYDEISQEYFKGLLGPIILIKNNEVQKKIAQIIYKILNLKEKYPFFIYSLCKDSIYKLDYMDNFKYYYNYDKEQLDLQHFNLFNNINELKEKFECLLYLTPSVIEYYSDMKESPFDKYYLPIVPNICEIQKYYNISALNISLIKYDNIPIDFLMNNGLYFICLQYEYLYQLVINLIRNNTINENKNDFVIKNEIKEIINNILYNTIKILIKYCNYIINFYGVFKMIFFNLFICIKYLNKYNKNIIFDSVIMNLGNLIVGIIDDINNKNENNSKNSINDNDIKKLIIFRDGLIDFLLSSELYDNAKLEIIKYIFTLLLSINKKVNKVKDNIFITNKNLLWKILSFIQLLENLFNDKDTVKENIKINEIANKKNQINNKNIQSEIFNLLKEYFLNIKSNENSKELFSDLLHFCLSNNKNKYYLIYNYFNLIYELIKNEYYYNENDIQILIDYLNELITINNNNNVNNENIINNNINVDNEIISKLISIILCILIDLIFVNISNKEINKNMIELINFIQLTNENVGIICGEIGKIFNFLFNNTKDDSKNFKLYVKNKQEIDISKVYSRLFKFIFSILKNIIINKNVEYNNIIKTKLTYEVLSLLISISKKINDEFLNGKKNEDTYFSLLNYIKFLYKIVFNEEMFNKFSLLEIDMFIFNLSDIVHLCSVELLLHTNLLIKIKTNQKYYKKTIIEIIIDTYINILFNEKFEKSHKLIYKSLNSLFDNIPIGKNYYTIFYYNDYLINVNKKKIKKEEQKIKTNIKKINEILMKKYKEKYEMSFITFFLLKLVAYYKYLQYHIIKNTIFLFDYLESIIKKLLEEHKDLYKLNENIFSKISNDFYYNHLKEKIESYILSISKNKNNSNYYFDLFLKLKEFFEQKLSKFDKPIVEEITSGNCNIKKNPKKTKSPQIIFKDNDNINNSINLYPNRSPVYSKRKLSAISEFSLNKSTKTLNIIPSLSLNEKDFNKYNDIDNDNDSDNDLQLNIIESDNIKESIIQGNIIDNNNEFNINNNINNESNTIINIVNDYIDNKKSEIKQINLLDIINYIYFFEDIDNNYVINYKKDLMNKIFSIYFIDTFFYNDLFQKMKIYYLNEYEGVIYDTKTLNFPSKIKNFNNGIEPCMFLKQHSGFFNSKYFPISHPYFVENMTNNNLYNKSIKLYGKELPNYLINNKDNILKISCELIKIDHVYFGQIIGFNKENQEKYIVFQEKEFIMENNDNIFDNEKNYQYLFSSSFLNYHEKKKGKKVDKKKLKKRKDKIIIILFSEIEEIVEKRYLLMWQGFEIYLKNGKSYFFNLFSEKKNGEFLEFFKKDETIKNLIHTRDFLLKEKEISKQWKDYKLTTYEYLLIVNKYASRTFNDNSQYPIFPWILIKDYEKLEEINEIRDNDDLIDKFFNNKGENINLDRKTKDLFKIIRKMKYPICIQTEEKRKDILEKYMEEDEKFKYHLGIHYSTSSYIYYYLMREEPYSDLLIKLQNYQQENPNRMFVGLQQSINLLQNSKDSREIIPELFMRIEYLINLNCDYYGKRFNDLVVDDNSIEFFNNNLHINQFYRYINFIIEHRKLLNSKIISININDWIDNVFGINQLPQNKKIRENSCNIFMKTSYAQVLNLQQKLEKYLQKIKNEDKNKINIYLTKILSKMNSILNFGQTPYQIFKENHYKRQLNELINIKKENKIKEKANNEDDDDDKDGDGFENIVDRIFKTQSINTIMKNNNNYIYFDINSKLDKIFAISLERNIEILNTKLFNQKGADQYSLSNHLSIQLPYFLFNERICIQLECFYFIYKIKYAFSSFDNINEGNYKNINTKENFHIYGRNIIENIIKNKEKEKKLNKSINKKKEINSNIYYKFITCRYIDKSFKIHRFPKDKNDINKDIYKPISYICEDFVCSCCAISFCQFLIGLKNGKLVQFYIEEQQEQQKELEKEKEKNKNKSNKNNEIGIFQIKMEKYIQAHLGKINVIEINKKLGLIITCGDDNYILIRKLYDFELLSPIKIKNKFIITMAKISPLNILYIICFNTQKQLSIIFGYTLTGLKIAKSEYGFYDNIDFTMNGNIITYKDYKELCILSGSELRNINMNKNDSNYEDFQKIKNKVKNSIWLRYDYFQREDDDENIYNKIITYYKIEDNNKLLATIDVSHNKYFD